MHTHIGVYITFARKEDAAKAIEAVDGSVCDNRMIRYFYFFYRIVPLLERPSIVPFF